MLSAAITAALALPRGLQTGVRPCALPLIRGGAVGRSGGRFSSSALQMAAAPDAVSMVVDDIASSPLDRRSYRWIELDSGLRALLISDPNTDKAAAALEVDAGHFNDPAGIAGLAHFTEHMMFLGTESYPDERAFKEFTSRHGGTSNAFTGMESTGYHFGIAATQLGPALDRFASFFREARCVESIFL